MHVFTGHFSSVHRAVFVNAVDDDCKHSSVLVKTVAHSRGSLIALLALVVLVCVLFASLSSIFAIHFILLKISKICFVIARGRHKHGLNWG